MPLWLPIRHADMGFAEYYPVAIFLKDANSAILGGVLGHLWGKWLRVAILWLAEPVRRQGYGSQLLLAAGGLRTTTRSSARAAVDVQFPGPSISMKSWAMKSSQRLRNCPVGHREYFLRKQLAEVNE